MAEATHSSEFLTLAAPAQAQLREKMSRFIAFAFPVKSTEEARTEIARVANLYHDARHVCWAYQLGAAGDLFMSNDNGEPSGTAGKPILGQIRSAGLTNVLICVVRYFGGIKLGTSGLITAYRQAARLAIQAADIVSDFERSRVEITFPYVAINAVMRLVKDPGLKILSQQFDNSCRMEIAVRSDRADALAQRLADVDELSITGITEIK